MRLSPQLGRPLPLLALGSSAQPAGPEPPAGPWPLQKAVQRPAADP